MDYFDFKNLNLFLNEAGKTYQTDSPGAKWYFDTRGKLQHLIDLLSTRLKVKFTNNYNEKPNRQGGQGMPFTLKPYILAGFVPDNFKRLGKNAFIKLSFYIDGKALFFETDVDINFSDRDNPFLRDRDKLQKDTYNSLPVDQKFPDNWEDLLDFISPLIEEDLAYFENHFGKGKTGAAKKTISANGYKMKQPLNQILFGPPGTGKTYGTIEKALHIIDPAFDLSKHTRKEVKDEYHKYVSSGQVVFTTFHQSMSYEDFIEGIKPVTTPENEVIYLVRDGIFKSICTKARESRIKTNNFGEIYKKFLKEIDDSPEKKLVFETLVQSKEFSVYKNSKDNIRFHANTEKAYEAVIKKEYLEQYLKTGETVDWPPYVKALGKYLTDKYSYTQSEVDEAAKYVLIIDEINRGNVSQIFGELITLIEEDKRQSQDESLSVVLPYSKEPFVVPENIYIIGTMNTADRSVEALDTALRRRFDFEEVAPDPSLISRSGKLKASNGVLDNIDLAALLTRINNRIEKLIDKDHLIGHSFFMQVDTWDKLADAFQNKILPLLQEYFYGDFGKIELVLGAGFIREKETVKNDKLFAKSKYDTSGLDLRAVYELVDYSRPVSYLLKIDDKDVEMNFPEAIKLLMA